MQEAMSVQISRSIPYLIAQLVKNQLQETQLLFLGLEDPLEKG